MKIEHFNIVIFLLCYKQGICVNFHTSSDPSVRDNLHVLKVSNLVTVMVTSVCVGTGVQVSGCHGPNTGVQRWAVQDGLWELPAARTGTMVLSVDNVKLLLMRQSLAILLVCMSCSCKSYWNGPVCRVKLSISVNKIYRLRKSLWDLCISMSHTLRVCQRRSNIRVSDITLGRSAELRHS
jgi:hypothetical protein